MRVLRPILREPAGYSPKNLPSPLPGPLVPAARWEVRRFLRCVLSHRAWMSRFGVGAAASGMTTPLMSQAIRTCPALHCRIDTQHRMNQLQATQGCLWHPRYSSTPARGLSRIRSSFGARCQVVFAVDIDTAPSG